MTVGTLIEEAIAGLASVSVTSADYTLTTANGASDDARKAIIQVTGTPSVARNVIIPGVSKLYRVLNTTGQIVTVKTAAAAGVAIAPNTNAEVYCDGTNCGLTALPYPTTGVYSLPNLTTTGAMTVGTTPTSTAPLTVIAATTAIGLSVKGRAADNIGAISLLSNDGTTEYGRLQSSPGNGIALYSNVAGTQTSVLTTDSSGNLYAPKTLYAQGGRAVAYGAGTNPAFTVWDTAQGVACGMMMGASLSLYFANMAGDGSYGGSYRAYLDSAGNFYASGTVNALSDRRLKTDFEAFDPTRAAIKGLARATSWYRWLADPHGAPLKLGFIAQDVQAALPAAVTDTTDGHLAVADRPIIAALTVALDRALDRIAALEARLAAA